MNYLCETQNIDNIMKPRTTSLRLAIAIAVIAFLSLGMSQCKSYYKDHPRVHKIRVVAA